MHLVGFHYKNKSRCRVLWMSHSYSFLFLPSSFQTHLLVYPIMISLSRSFLPYFYPISSIFLSYRHSAFPLFVLNHSILKIFFDSFEPSEYLCRPSPPPSQCCYNPFCTSIGPNCSHSFPWSLAMEKNLQVFFPFLKGSSTFENFFPPRKL